MSVVKSATLFDPFFARAGVVILDGALATELERRGALLNDALWSARLLIEDPDLIYQVHYDYLAAGADVITTASYQATFPGFARRGLGHACTDDALCRTLAGCQRRGGFGFQVAGLFFDR